MFKAIFKGIFGTIWEALEAMAEQEKAICRLMCVDWKLNDKVMDDNSEATTLIINGVYKRALLGYDIGNVDYVYNRKSMRTLLKMLVKNGYIKK